MQMARAAMAVAFSVAILGATTACSAPPSGPPEPDTIGAWVACQEFVGKRLKAPSTADYQSYDKGGVTIKTDSSFTVRGYVDAQNSFGAKLRSTYTCEVHSAANQWILDDITIQ
jgi:hypothetical protein